MQGNWRMLFERLDTDGSGMLHYGEFQEALRDVLSLQVAEELAEVPISSRSLGKCSCSPPG